MVRIVNYKNLIKKSAVYPNGNVCTYIWTYGITWDIMFWLLGDGIQIYLMCDLPAEFSGHYLVFTEVRERSSVGNQQCKILIWRDQILCNCQILDKIEVQWDSLSVNMYDWRTAYDLVQCKALHFILTEICICLKLAS